MNKEKILELGEKLGLNKPALENQIKEDRKVAEKMVTDSAKFMGVK